ncbi:MAG: hypothetical protein AB3N15_14345 [Paracoccaceae bacterium]
MFIRDSSIQDAAINTRYQNLFFEDGRYLMDDMVRVENFAEDVGRIWNKLSLPAPNRLHVNSNGRKKNYREFYDEEAIEIVRDILQRDIDVFGYTF